MTVYAYTDPLQNAVVGYHVVAPAASDVVFTETKSGTTTDHTVTAGTSLDVVLEAASVDDVTFVGLRGV